MLIKEILHIFYLVNEMQSNSINTRSRGIIKVLILTIHRNITENNKILKKHTKINELQTS